VDLRRDDERSWSAYSEFWVRLLMSMVPLLRLAAELARLVAPVQGTLYDGVEPCCR